MFRSASARLVVTLLVSVLGFVLTLDTPLSLLDEPLAMQTPQR